MNGARPGWFRTKRGGDGTLLGWPSHVRCVTVPHPRRVLGLIRALPDSSTGS